jgi:hypothetical protein
LPNREIILAFAWRDEENDENPQSEKPVTQLRFMPRHSVFHLLIKKVREEYCHLRYNAM